MTHVNPLLRRSSQNMSVDENPYHRFGLRENPFPDSPTVTPESSDPRVNGEIYCDALRKKEQEQFEHLLIPLSGEPEPRRIALLMDYATRRGRGIGKTAFINHQRRRIMADLGNDLTSGSHVLLASHMIPEGGGRTRKFWQFVRLIAYSLNSSSCIASAVCRLRAFSGQIPDETLLHVDPQNMGVTLGNDRWLQDQNVDVLFSLRSAVERLLIENGVSREVARALASYGHSPEEWERHFLSQQNDFRWRQDGDHLVFNDFVRLFQAAEINRVLLLVDEIEKIVVPQNSLERRTFVDDLRRFFIDGPYQSVYSRLYSLLLTIHPYIQELWTPHWQAAGLDRVCPLSGGIAREYTVYFYPLDAEEAAVPLVLTYLDHFRTSADQQGTLNPFGRNAVVEALRLAGGVPGPMLTLLRLVLEKAINQDWDTINEEQIQAVYEYEIPAEPSKQDEVGALSPTQTDLLREG